MALPRTARLRDGRDVQAVSRRGAHARAGDVSAAVRREPDGLPARVVVVVGKRAGGAVQRNRLRRRLQHAVAPLLPTLPLGCDVVLRSGPDAAALGPSELSSAVRSCVTRAVDRAAPTSVGASA